MQTTVYIRKENEEYWNSLAEKSLQVNHWITVAKGGESTQPLNASPTTQPIVKEAANISGVVRGTDNMVCKGHQMRWDCGRKGCKKGA